jgi:hypothetical protein
MKSILLGSLACLLSLGCSADVRVVDEKGSPLEGAAVEPVSLSMNGPGILTDADGEVSLPFTVQEWKWVTVSKRGYGRVHVGLSPAKPTSVVLKADPGK